MDGIRAYLLRLTAAALVCGILTALCGKKGAVGGVIRLLTGVYLTLNILAPWVQLRLDSLSELAFDWADSAQTVSQSGENTAREEMAACISENIQAYILDKARTLEAELTVEVQLSEDAIPVPCGVRIRGNISPYAKKVLSNMMETELGIPPEEQLWT